MSAALSLQLSYYDALKQLTLELAGVKLGENHKFLVETRLAALARREGFETMPDMIDELFSRGQTRLAVNVVSALIERDMRFFYDKAGFAALEDIALPRLMAVYKDRPIKVLSFGCGTGQDAVSLAIILDKLTKNFPKLTFEITGVDYPSHALSRAQEGRYTHFEVQRGLPARDLVKYFERKDEDWCVAKSLAAHIKFEEFHLLSNAEPLGQYQIIMFRGALKRYSPPAQMRILRSLAPAVVPHGYFLLGSAEDLSGLNFGFEPCSDDDGLAGGLYRKLEPLAPAEPEPEPAEVRTTFEKAKKRAAAAFKS